MSKLEELRESAVLLAQEPPKFVRGTLYGSLLLAVVLVGWSYVVRVPVIVAADGQIRSGGRIRLVDAETGGRVVAADAQEHQKVEKGDLLLKLDPAPLLLEMSLVDRELEQLRPERDELLLMAQELARYTSGRPAAMEGLRRHRERFAAWMRELDLAAVNVQRKKQDVARLEPLEAVVSAAERASARLAMSEAENGFSLILARHRAEVERELDAVTRKLEALAIQRSQKKDQLDRLDIRAPVRGTITFTAVRHVGEVVKAGQLLYQVAPEGAGFVAEVWVPAHQAGFVTPGMEARVDVPTFPEAHFGWLGGKVLTVSPDASEGPKGSSSEPLYRAEIAVDRDTLQSKDGRVGQLRLGLRTRARLVVREERLLLRLVGALRESFRWGS